jgi:hypothetical protein
MEDKRLFKTIKDYQMTISTVMIWGFYLCMFITAIITKRRIWTIRYIFTMFGLLGLGIFLIILTLCVLPAIIMEVLSLQ